MGVVESSVSIVVIFSCCDFIASVHQTLLSQLVNRMQFDCDCSHFGVYLLLPHVGHIDSTP